MGFSDVAVTVSLHQWMGGFPKREAKGLGVIPLGAVTAALGPADKVVTKPHAEPLASPPHPPSCRRPPAPGKFCPCWREQPMPHSPAIEEESRLIGEETRSIVDCVLQLGNGMWPGRQKGWNRGSWMSPLLPSHRNLPTGCSPPGTTRGLCADL